MTRPSGTESAKSTAPAGVAHSWPVRRRGISAPSGDLAYPYISAILLVLIAFAMRYALDPVLLERSPLLIFTAAIVIAAGRYGTAPGLAAMILSLVLGTFVFMRPGFPAVLSADDVASLGVFVVTSGAMLSFAGHLKQLREREADLQAELRQVQTETAMGTMAATLAHELNQPLAAAVNYVGAGKRLAAGLEGDMQETLVSGLGEAEAQIHRAGEIVRQARNLVSNASAARKPASLRDMIANTLKPLQAGGACENLKLNVEVEPSADRLLVNEIQIEQVLLNVIRNACQAVPAEETAEVEITATANRDQVAIQIRDFGPGIAITKMPSLFKAGGGSTSGGQGLGLSISRTIVEAHGGSMWAQNADGGGASFFFTLPKVEES
jgi:two-component system, LuxR family, sensor kinase FixL